MILVDTSVWIGFFNEFDSPTVRLLENFIEAEEDICLSGLIVTEVLQGFRNEKDFELAKKASPTISNLYFQQSTILH